MTKDEQRKLEELVDFCRRFGGPDCYRDWSRETLREYLEHHIAHWTLVYVQTFAQVTGVAVAWQCQERELRACLKRGRPPFHWQATDPTGDCVFVADVVCTNQGSLALALGSLLGRHPRWQGLKVLTFRHGKLVEYKWRVFELIQAAQRRRMASAGISFGKALQYV